MAFDLSSVFNLNRLLDGLIHENVSKVDLLLSQIGFRSETLSFQFKRKSFFSTGNVAESNAFIGVGLSWTKSDCDSDFTIRPYLSNQRFYFEDVVLEEKEVIFNGFSNCLVFSS